MVWTEPETPFTAEALKLRTLCAGLKLSQVHSCGSLLSWRLPDKLQDRFGTMQGRPARCVLGKFAFFRNDLCTYVLHLTVARTIKYEV